ncbi:amidohydrolase [Jeotgalibacillus haloalkalitolerans]|uniref:Amidohydrolase n=1 Tax=Jeotgalibacillus haloalkalitolerans TaxID=3104292 RepID=A0ABU5KMJ3_9BACL|nr:amidohydrolase [Jeotgalibacillus sp. HH7-29]MDZ5712479.1 amidohydrolase [Jeotgalibacillus sp. HH7-29]
MLQLFKNGTIYTMEQEGVTAEAVLTSNGKIKAVGSEEECLASAGNEQVTTVDLNGKTMFPGFVDSHLHIVGVGETLLRLDLSEMKSKQEVIDAVAKKARELPKGEWIQGDGWNENQWEDASVPTAAELDAVAPDHPVVLKRICRHAVVVNSFALFLARIDEQTPDPEGGVIEHINGNLTGQLKDTAQDLMIPALPPIEDEYIQKALKTALEHAWSLGLTGGHTEDLSYYGDFTRTYRAFQKVIEEDGRPFRAHLLVHHHVIEDWHRQGHSFLSGSRYVEFGAMKIFADGALGGRTALLKNGYADAPGEKGVAIHTPEKLKQLVWKARQYDMAVAVHTIGDQAFEYMLDAIEAYPSNGERDRLIHAQILDEELIQRAEKLPIVLDIQPRFVPSDFPWVQDRIGKDRMKWNYAWKTLMDRGIACAGGSDAPIEPVDPLLGIHAAVTRTKPEDPDKTVYGESEKLSMYEGISLFTKCSAYACHHEHDRGMIKPGFAADFTVLESNPFKEDPDQLLTMKVERTIVDGKTVYKRNGE